MGKTPDVVAITFHPALTPALSDATRSLTLHKEFIQGKHREFDQLIYQWCRQTVQHNHVPSEYSPQARAPRGAPERNVCAVLPGTGTHGG